MSAADMRDGAQQPVEVARLQRENAWLVTELHRLQDLVTQLSGAWHQPYTREPTDEELREQATAPFQQVVEYQVQMRVPGWPILGGRFRLTTEMFNASYGDAVFDESVRRAHGQVKDLVEQQRRHPGRAT